MRAIESCLACESESLEPNVIVIDGESTDGSYEMLHEKYDGDSRIKLRKEPKEVDFMSTCIIGVNLVETELATFMYDDDVISPYFKDAVHHMLGKNHDFIMGYGRIYPVERIYPFKPVAEIKEQDPCGVLMGHYGDTSALKFPVLPVSPICCVVKTNRLQNWVEILKKFTSVNSFRHYFLMKKNIGPDLLIFISSMISDLESGQKTLVVSSVLGQFSEHGTSMSIQYGSQHLAVGYWVAKVWGFEQLLRLGKKKEAAKAGAYLIIFGFSLLAGQLRRGQCQWMGFQLAEIFGVMFKSFTNGMSFDLLVSIKKLVFKRLTFGKNIEAASWLYGQGE